jgi:glucan phosphorylase
MPTYHIYNVIPTLPTALEPLREMVFNLWWTWEPSARRLFRHLDPELWNRTNHNPVRMLQLSRQARLVEVSQDKNFLRELKEVHDAFSSYLGRKIPTEKPEKAVRLKDPWLIFLPNSVSTNQFRIIPAVLEF